MWPSAKPSQAGDALGTNVLDADIHAENALQLGTALHISQLAL